LHLPTPPLSPLELAVHHRLPPGRAEHRHDTFSVARSSRLIPRLIIPRSSFFVPCCCSSVSLLFSAGRAGTQASSPVHGTGAAIVVEPHHPPHPRFNRVDASSCGKPL
jgi:hypothetical protein